MTQRQVPDGPWMVPQSTFLAVWGSEALLAKRDRLYPSIKKMLSIRTIFKAAYYSFSFFKYNFKTWSIRRVRNWVFLIYDLCSFCFWKPNAQTIFFANQLWHTEILGPGNPRHSSNQSCRSDNARSLTHGATREHHHTILLSIFPQILYIKEPIKTGERLEQTFHQKRYISER